MNMGNYQVLEQIGATAGGMLHIARQIQDGTAVLLKLPARDNAAHSLRHEYALLRSLDVPEILRPLALHEDGPRLALILEPFAGEGLDAVLVRQQRFGLPVALTMACQLARTLAALHAAGIAHRDLRPANLLLARDGVQVKLADLSQAAAREDATSARPAVVDWAYVSPEQTGRMNRQADYRTDFYSLGILLYRLLTGQLPFQADDLLEWVHCHLARMPVPLHRLMPDIPQAVSDLVLKLLAKVPEERYQSASGLLADLEHCLDQWQASGWIAPFALGSRDRFDRFQIPHKLYGREQEKASLLAAFETAAATGASMLVTVAGYSGVGKSALVQSLQQPIAEKHGYFIAGKFDQYQRDIPYATLAQAFDRLVRQLLGENDAAIKQWRQALSEALEPNGQLMVNLIPQIELVIGPQPPVSDLPLQEAQGRFQLVFRRFIGVFAKQEHPLVLFLDDLQWADAATLALIEHLMTHPDVYYLLLLGAYRDNEVEATHPLRQRLQTIREAGAAVREIVLAPLPPDDVARLVAESLHCPLAEAQPLAQLVLDKTGGNPFFTIQFMTALAEEKLLRFDADAGAWHWNLLSIHAKGYTDNVVDLMVGKLARLPQQTQDALAQFACLGNATDSATLGIVLEQSVEAVHTVLLEAERAGLVCRQENAYTFLHDRVQEAAYSLVPPDSRVGMHLAIGRILAARLPPEAIEGRIFEVVGQLNRGSELVESQEERERIAELNLLAGQHAKAATAYTSALAYLAAAAALLTEDCWEHRHELMFQVELNRAECEFLTGAQAEAEERLGALSTRAVTIVEQATVTCLRVDLYTTLEQSDRAIAVGLDYLRQLNIDWPLHPTEEDVRHEYERVWSQIGSREIEDLIDLPLMTDPTSLATLDVLSKIAAPAMSTNVNMSSVIACKAVSLSLEHGVCHGSCPAYEWLAIVAGPRLGDYQAAYRFGRLGYELVAKRGLKRFDAMTYLIFGGTVIPWTRHVKTGQPILRQAFEMANRISDLPYAAYSCDQLDTNLLADEQAIRSAHDNGFVQNEAIVSERAARFYLAHGLTLPGNAYLEQARACYARWGAAGKVKQLEEQYPQLRAHTGHTPAEGEIPLDLLSVAKASQAISGQILLDELIDTLMRLMLESAGAQTGSLLLAQGDELALVAEARVEQQAMQVSRHAGQPLSQSPLPLSTLQYVRRSREPVLLMEAAAPHPFATDPYFAQQHPQSVLCLPILRQSELVGVLYLENNLATHAFTPDRVRVLELLASQAAISLDNARLYADVRDSHARIRRLFESNIIGILFWDLNGNITDANDAFLRMTGYAQEDVKSGMLRWTAITPPEYREIDARAVEELERTGSAQPFEKEYIRKDGTRIPVLIGVALFEQSQDSGVAFVLDLTERKQVEAEREARHAAEAANRAKSAFLASMSHELRTPLNGILGYAQILERDSVLGERQLAGVNVIKKSGEHLLTLINDILDLAKIESGKMELYPVDITLARFVQTITEIVGVKAAQKGLELGCDLATDLPQGVRADEKRLRQALLNLLSNAIKFTDAGRVTLRVRFAPPARLGFEVQDTGIGIAANQLAAIFEPFEQAGDMQRRLAGTGLGLTISRQYVRLMGGEIQVESQVGRGSTFRFEVEAPPLQVATAVIAAKTVAGYAGPRKKVLVVDDIAENRSVVTALLTPLGFEVAEASNGREVLERAQRLRPDLILMDIVMPEMDGLSTARRLRQLEAFRDVPVIAMSASVSASDSEQSLAAGMNAFLSKPFAADQLLVQIARLLQLE